MTEYTIHHLPTLGLDGVKFMEGANPIYIPAFEISDGKVLPMKLPEGFIPGVPVTLTDVRKQASFALNASRNHEPGVEHFCHVVLFDDNPYAMGVLVTKEPARLC